jgi:hypothetical protein
MSAVFDPQHLTPRASLNRVRIVDIPTLDLPAEVRGRTAYELLSAEAIAKEVAKKVSLLHIASDAAATVLLPALDRCFDAVEPRIRMEAEAIAERCGRNLGYLVATLKRGDAASRRARPEWDDSYWDYWARVRHIRLGGGLVSGNLGRRLRDEAQRIIDVAGASECQLSIADYPAVLPLIGAARGVPPDHPAALVFDFGQSFVKRAYARYARGTLQELQLLAPVAVPPDVLEAGGQQGHEGASRLATFMCRAMAETWAHIHAQHGISIKMLVTSVAAYIADNQPLPGQGGPYARLAALAEDTGGMLADGVRRRVGHAVDLTLLHDGTAAARTYAGAGHTAVIMLGTALGSGFPPSATGLRPLADDFAVHDEAQT